MTKMLGVSMGETLHLVGGGGILDQVFLWEPSLTESLHKTNSADA